MCATQPLASVIRTENGASRLAPWKDAVNALPVVEALRLPLAKAGPLWVGVAGTSTATLIIATRGNVLSVEIGPTQSGVITPVKLQKLTLSTAIAAISAHWPTSGKTEVPIIGPESTAFTDLRALAKTNASLGTLFVKGDGNSVELIGRACAIAASWSKETLTGLGKYIQGKEFIELPDSCLTCASDTLVYNIADAAALRHLIRDGADEFCKECGITLNEFMRNVRQLKKNLYERLGTACNAFAMGYLLHSMAKVVSDAEVAGLRAIAELGTENVGRYQYFSTAIAQVGDGQREKIAKKMIKLVGSDCEEEVRGSFNVPMPELVVAARPEPPQAPAFSAPPRVAAPKAAAQQPPFEQQIAAIQKELPGVPFGFIAKWFGTGMRNPAKIRAKYDQVLKHAPGMKRDSDEGTPQTGTTVHVNRTLEDRIAAVEFAPVITAAMRARGVEPLHMGFALCKVFNYPLSPSPRKKDGVEGYLAKYLNGRVPNPTKTADSVFRFMGDAGLIVSSDKTMRINAGTENPTGRAILQAIRAGFGE